MRGLYKKSCGKESYLAYPGQTLAENRHGLMAVASDGFAERVAELIMLRGQRTGRIRRITLGVDRAHDSKKYVELPRSLNVILHVTKNNNKRCSSFDRRSARYAGYGTSMSNRCLKQTGPMRQVKLCGLHKIDWLFIFSCACA